MQGVLVPQLPAPAVHHTLLPGKAGLFLGLTLVKGAGSLRHSTGGFHSPCSPLTPVLMTMPLFIAFLKGQAVKPGNCFLGGRMQGNYQQYCYPKLLYSWGWANGPWKFLSRLFSSHHHIRV